MKLKQPSRVKKLKNASIQAKLSWLRSIPKQILEELGQEWKIVLKRTQRKIDRYFIRQNRLSLKARGN